MSGKIGGLRHGWGLTYASTEGLRDPRLMWFTLGVLYLAGSVIGSLSLLLPHPEGFDTAGLWSNIALSIGVSVIALAFADRLPLWGIHAALAIGAIVVTRAVYLSGEAGGYYVFFYVWAALFAFFFLGRRWGLVYTGLLLAGYGWALVELPRTTPVALWLMLAFTIGIGGLMIEIVVSRLQRAAEHSADVARERAELLAKLEEVVRTDDLTGLPNRRAWDEELERELARAGRTGESLCVALLDLDRFKEYNDRQGHQAGNRLLEEISALWRQRLRATDTLARYGGEEFAVGLPNCDPGTATELIERLREVMPGHETCSAGLVCWDESESAAALIGRADAALYRAKESGRNRVVAS
jgi:diguanylate cyclase (GGDEF)-like protein